MDTRDITTGLRNAFATLRGTSKNVATLERIGSLAAGGALVWIGLRRSSWPGRLLALAGAGLIHRGATGYCSVYNALGVSTRERSEATVIPAGQGYKVEELIAVNRPVEDVYEAWSNLADLPEIMQHLVSVDEIDDRRSHWVAKGPMDKNVEWDAETIERVENAVISWRSLPGSEIDTAGSVHFTPMGNGRGTALRVSIKYNPPMGKAGAAIASLLGHDLREKIVEDLHRFKKKMESFGMVDISTRSDISY